MKRLPTRRPARALFAATLLLPLALIVSGSEAGAIELNSVEFPERRDVALQFAYAKGAARVDLKADVEYREGQARIELSFDGMKPAVLYGGDVTCYVLWAVTVSGEAENLGEMLVREPKSELEFSTGKKKFALLVTAEPYYLVRKPSALVAFYNAPSREKQAPSQPFEFTNLDAKPAHALDDITSLAWDSTIPLDLLQARKAYELAGRRGATEHAPELYREAKDALDKANDLASKSPRNRELLDYARRSVALSNEAINITVHRLEGIEIERQIAARRAEMEALEKRAAEAETEAQRAQLAAEESAKDRERVAAELSSKILSMKQEEERLMAEKETLTGDLATLQEQRARLEQEKSVLGSRLQDALAHVAETTETARGFVVSLPDILFDVDQSTLKADAKLILAKLSGILLVMPDLKVAVEGHTDSTGSAEYNMDLSRRRALSVKEFIQQQGVEGDRLESAGYGMDRPVASNDTKEGRAKNRRVEIVISE